MITFETSIYDKQVKESIEDIARTLAARVDKNGFHFIVILNGGTWTAKKLTEQLNYIGPYSIVYSTLNFQRDSKGTLKKCITKPRIIQSIAQRAKKQYNVLIDDITHTGETLSWAKELLKNPDNLNTIVGVENIPCTADFAFYKPTKKQASHYVGWGIDWPQHPTFDRNSNNLLAIPDKYA